MIRKLHIKLREILDAEDITQLREWRKEYRQAHNAFNVSCSDELSAEILDDYSDSGEGSDEDEEETEGGNGENSGDGENGGD